MSQHENSNAMYANDVLSLHEKGTINAFAEYTKFALLSDFPHQRPNESEHEFIFRCAYADFDDAPFGQVVFSEVAAKYNAIKCI